MAECRFLKKKFMGGYECTAVEPSKALGDEVNSKCKIDDRWKDCEWYIKFFAMPKFRFR